MSANEFYSSGEQGQYNNQYNDRNQPQQPIAQNGEKGLLATIGGGAAGAYGGGKLFHNHSTLGKIGGAVVGAIAANKIEHKFHDHRHNHGYNGYNNGYGGPGRY